LRIADEFGQGMRLICRTNVVLIPLQKEVVPVDTHVYQIATKHYGMKSPASGNKVNMTPKLYEEVNAKFFSIWGDYAGWAHTVRRLFPS